MKQSLKNNYRTRKPLFIMYLLSFYFLVFFCYPLPKVYASIFLGSTKWTPQCSMIHQVCARIFLGYTKCTPQFSVIHQMYAFGFLGSTKCTPQFSVIDQVYACIFWDLPIVCRNFPYPSNVCQHYSEMHNVCVKLIRDSKKCSSAFFLHINLLCFDVLYTSSLTTLSLSIWLEQEFYKGYLYSYDSKKESKPF